MSKIYSPLFMVIVCVFMAGAMQVAGAQEQPTFQSLSSTQIDQAQKNKAQQIATATLGDWFKGKFGPLSDAFTPEMQEALPPEGQQQVVGTLKTKLGDFQSMEFAQAVASPNLPDMVVYRFKAKFSRADQPPEVRVSMDKQGKVAGFWIKPWQETMQ